MNNMEENDVDKKYLIKSMERIKHCLVLIAFGAPLIIFGLKLCVWV